ncbi:MAG TPA: hypothetical protein VIF09_08035 [Polyangiaceae bacterium]|jgi:hypothetical protein
MRTVLPLFVACFALFAAAVSCAGVKADTGSDAYMLVPGAQFVRGPMPDGSDAGPAVDQLNLIGNDIWPGMNSDPIGGVLDSSATGAAVGLQGDVGYWIVTAGVPSVATPNNPSFSATAEFSPGIVPGNYTLVARAVDSSGAFGPPASQVLTAVESPTNPPATGELVVTLTWDTESNLALHVVDPGGAEIYWGAQSSEPPSPNSATDAGSYGYIDYDSNGGCVIDGLRREDVVWPSTPPSGQYTVRVDAPSLCGQPDAYWAVHVVLQGNEIAHASGVAVDADTRGSHGVGSGVLALQFTVP